MQHSSGKKLCTLVKSFLTLTSSKQSLVTTIGTNEMEDMGGYTTCNHLRNTLVRRLLERHVPKTNFIITCLLIAKSFSFRLSLKNFPISFGLSVSTTFPLTSLVQSLQESWRWFYVLLLYPFFPSAWQPLEVTTGERKVCFNRFCWLKIFPKQNFWVENS